ncbi:alpha-L-rhamnosidase-related protein [Mucilaginibacter sp.]
MRRLLIALIFLCLVQLSSKAQINLSDNKTFIIKTGKMSMVIDYNHKAGIVSLITDGKKVVNGDDGIFTSLKVNGLNYSSLNLKSQPNITKSGNTISLTGINYGDKTLNITEEWKFTIGTESVKWEIRRTLSKAVDIEESGFPVFNFTSINTWEGAYQGYGGIAWFYLFNQPNCTYGVHTRSSDFWNSKNGNGLNITVNSPGEQEAMKYSRTTGDRLNYTITASDKEMAFKYDSGTNRRRFIRTGTDVWAPFKLSAVNATQTITFTYFDYNQKYGRGKLAGLNDQQVSGVLGTIARVGVIDSLHYGGNSWATPYGPICLHEQYIAQLGLGIDDPNYLTGYKSCLDFYRDHAIEPDGRIYPRWAYTNEDAMPGKYNQYGFYEAQWGMLLDSQPDFVTNVAELYDLTGDKTWVKTHQLSCEKVLDWLLKRDSNHNGLVEMMTDSTGQKRSSDWIDIIWASYENAFVNANLYHALIKWAEVERQLHNDAKASYYKKFAAKLKAGFNKPTTQGGFWDEEKQCYVHWRDKDGSIHGDNMVTPVNFMAIAYGICDDPARKKMILDQIESQMRHEKLFFWPLVMSSYKPSEGKEYQFPFPEYENGDLFLSWGALGVNAYAGYDPDIAVKYVKNVLAQYGKDGLAYQRYGRLKQDGRGDDILAGNSLTTVGLYQAIYGVNPLYNRMYLNPHITPELSGTELNYNFRGQKLLIKLDTGNYAISNGIFTLACDHDFGYSASKNEFTYYNKDNSLAALQVKTSNTIKINITHWDSQKMSWIQRYSIRQSAPVVYLISGLKPDKTYAVMINGTSIKKIKCNTAGQLMLKNIGKIGQEVVVRSSE